MKNNKAFAMAELLTVIILILVIFAMIYSTFIPTTAEYEKRKYYQDVSSTYKAYYYKKIYKQYSLIDLNNQKDNYITLYDGTCNYLDSSMTNLCNEYSNLSNIKKALLVKDINITTTDESLNDYLKYLKNTKNSSYQIIIETKSNKYAAINF